jgi:hypothetical protein
MQHVFSKLKKELKFFILPNFKIKFIYYFRLVNDLAEKKYFTKSYRNKNKEE